MATVEPATFQLAARPSAASAKPSTCEPESPMNTSALRPGRRLNGRNPAHAHAPASANARCASSGWTVTASIAKNPNAIPASVAARPSMLSSRLNALVIPTSQKIASGHATTCVWISSTPVPVASTITAAAICSASFSFGESATHVVDEPGDEQERDPGVDPCDLLARRDRAGGDGGPDPDAQPGEDPDASEERGRDVVPALARGDGDESPLQPRREEEPDRER